MNQVRKVVEQIKAQPASDGDGVKLLRVFGGVKPERFDPFLLMDEFGSEEASDYIGGFPPHPHRGFETITYMLQGKMEHRDHMDNVGLLKDGDVQWMTAGKGVIHSEMPQQTEGKMRGFQVWLNLPAKNKLTPARYQDVAGATIPAYVLDGVTIKAIAGKTIANATDIAGYFDVEDTEPLYLDIHLSAGSAVTIDVPESHNAFTYNYDGEIVIGESETPSKPQHLSRLSEGKQVILKNMGEEEARVIFLAGAPLQEPIAQYGPFVMNTPEEIDQAIVDFRAGSLV